MSVRHRLVVLALTAGVIVGAAITPGAQTPPSGGTGAAALKALARESLSRIDGAITVPGVKEPVEVIRDKWGVTHIYARNQEDMFFAQGYVIGQDRSNSSSPG